MKSLPIGGYAYALAPARRSGFFAKSKGGKGAQNTLWQHPLPKGVSKQYGLFDGWTPPKKKQPTGT